MAVSQAEPGEPITSFLARRPACGRRKASTTRAAQKGIDHGASNEWVIAGSRTKTGKPILANDPISISARRSLWYLVRIDTPDETLGLGRDRARSACLLVLLGRNKQIAWGLTTSQTRHAKDLFVEFIDPANAANYLTPDGAKPFDTRDETIHVKDAADVKITARATRHGPVLSIVSKEFAAVAVSPTRSALSLSAGLSGRRYDLRGDPPRSTPRITGTSFSMRSASIRRPPRTSSMPMSPEISASSTPASCRCESPATVLSRSTARRAPSTGRA